VGKNGSLQKGRKNQIAKEREATASEKGDFRRIQGSDLRSGCSAPPVNDRLAEGAGPFKSARAIVKRKDVFDEKRLTRKEYVRGNGERGRGSPMDRRRAITVLSANGARKKDMSKESAEG